MTMRIPTTADIAAVETELWNVVRTINAIEALAVRIALKTDGEVNEMAEFIAGTAAATVSHVRRQQIALGGAE